jgi:hypothetical protein
MAVALAMEGSVGFGIQSAKGTYVAPTTWLPVLGRGEQKGETLGLRQNYVMLDLADSRAYQTQYYSAGTWVAGEIRFPVVPGSLSALFSWIQDRDSNNQAKWASVLVDCVHEVKKLTDVKVDRAVLDLVKGEPAVCTLEVCGLQMETGTAMTPTMPVAAPYLFNEAQVQIAAGGGSLAEDLNCERLQIVFENMLEDPEEGLRLGESGEPLQLYNLAGMRCSGSLTRDFVDSALYSDFRNGQEAALQLTLTRGATTATISLPRVLYTSSDLGLPGSHADRIAEEVQFVALGAADGLTPPAVLA